MTRSMEELMSALGPYHDALDEIGRAAHALYRTYSPAQLVEHSARSQANVIYDHAVAEAERRLLDDSNVLTKEIRRLQVWIFKEQDIVLRFKKMDRDGLTQSYQTKQQKSFDRGEELPGLPYPPERLTFGYLLDATGVEYVRTQIAQPKGASVLWCAALVPAERREAGEASWQDVTRQRVAF
jgi:hypothetical protein